jgi:hypothetical protein
VKCRILDAISLYDFIFEQNDDIIDLHRIKPGGAGRCQISLEVVRSEWLTDLQRTKHHVAVA